MINHGGHAVQGVVAVSDPAYLESVPFVAPDAPGLGLTVHQPGTAAALRPGDGRITGVSYSGGLLWAGAMLCSRKNLGRNQHNAKQYIGVGHRTQLMLRSSFRAGASTAASVDNDLVQGAVYWVIDPAATSQAYMPAILNQG